MDIFSHAAWGATIVRKRPLVWWALFFGAGPDVLGSGPGALYLLFVKGMLWGSKTWGLMPELFRENYAFWHSLLGSLVVFIFLSVLGKRFIPLIFPYLVHVFLDLLTHKTDMLSRLYYPFVEYSMNRVTGVNWWESGTVWWMCTAVLILVNLLFRMRSKRGL